MRAPNFQPVPLWSWHSQIQMEFKFISEGQRHEASLLWVWVHKKPHALQWGCSHEWAVSAAIPMGRRMSTCKTPGDRECSVIGTYYGNYFSITTRPSQGWITCGKRQDIILFDQELTLTPSLTASAAAPKPRCPSSPAAPAGHKRLWSRSEGVGGGSHAGGCRAVG